LHVSALHRLRLWIREEVAGLHPGCFALVMATGIISNGLFLGGYHAWSELLFAVILIAYPALILLTLLRLALFPRALCSDLINPASVFAFFTIVAGTGVFAVALNLRGMPIAALLLWLAAFALWLALIYLGFAVMILAIRPVAPTSRMAAGSMPSSAPSRWSSSERWSRPKPAISVLPSSSPRICCGAWGLPFTASSSRCSPSGFFFDVEPDDITPLLWVVMGAAAIATNAGSTLILAKDGTAFLQAMRPLVDGVTLVMWAWASWWIPMLVLLGLWKHGVRRLPLKYTPTLWSLVFPLGMYALASLRFSLAAELPPLKTISVAMTWMALAAWAATALALVHACWRRYRAFDRESPVGA
jgi:tellurite resistance protein TehA-like permease